jgi:hypothetical protein
MEPLNLLHVFKEYYSKHTNVVVAAIQTRDQNFHKTTTVSSYTPETETETQQKLRVECKKAQM